jgi:hypothetical protein
MSAMFMWSCYPDVGHDLIIDHVLLYREWVDEFGPRPPRTSGDFCWRVLLIQRRTGTRYPRSAFHRTAASQVRNRLVWGFSCQALLRHKVREPQPSEYTVGRERLDFIFKPRPTNFRSSGRIKWCAVPALVICCRDEFLDEIKSACQRVARCRPESPTA